MDSLLKMDRKRFWQDKMWSELHFPPDQLRLDCLGHSFTFVSFQLSPRQRTSRSAPTRSTSTPTRPRPSVTTAARCCGASSVRDSSVKVRQPWFTPSVTWLHWEWWHLGQDASWCTTTSSDVWPPVLCKWAEGLNDPNLLSERCENFYLFKFLFDCQFGFYSLFCNRMGGYNRSDS